MKLDKDVEFTVNELNLTPYLSGPLQSDSRPVFDMYGVVCHFGSVYGGHYTAFAKNLGSQQWNHYNDNAIQESKIPSESPEDHSSGYILFYQRSGNENIFVLYTVDNRKKTHPLPVFQPFVFPVYLRNRLSYKKSVYIFLHPFLKSFQLE